MLQKIRPEVNSNYIPNQDSVNRVHMEIEITKKQYHTESLTSLGVAQKDLLSVGIGILDWTFTGMVLGGVIFISEKLTGT